MRSPQPALGYRRVRVDRALEGDLAQVRSVNPEDQKQVGVRRGGGDKQLGRQRPGDLRFLASGAETKVRPVAQRLELQLGRILARVRATAVAGRVQIELGPLRARNRPLVFEALDELIEVADLQLHLGPLVPAVVLALEEMGEELFLNADAVVGVEVRPVLDAVHLEPFLFRGGAAQSLRNCRADAAPARPSSRPTGTALVTLSHCGERAL